MRPEHVFRVDLVGQVLARGDACPGADVLAVEFGCLAGVPGPVSGLSVKCVFEDPERGPCRGAEVVHTEGVALLYGPDRRLVAAAGQQGRACVLAEELQVVGRLDLVADHGHGDVVRHTRRVRRSRG